MDFAWDFVKSLAFRPGLLSFILTLSRCLLSISPSSSAVSVPQWGTVPQMQHGVRR